MYGKGGSTDAFAAQQMLGGELPLGLIQHLKSSQLSNPQKSLRRRELSFAIFILQMEKLRTS